MSKISLTSLVNLNNQTTAVNAINTNNATLTAALDNTLSRDGTSPNQMSASLDMNSSRILNLPAPASNNEPLRLIDGLASGGIQGPQGIQGATGLQGIPGVVQSITAGTGVSVTGTAGIPIVSNTGVTSVTAGTGIAVTGTTTPAISVTSATNAGNFLPNCQWQVWTVGAVTKMNAAGTAVQTTVSVTSFDTTNGQPRFFTANTQAIRVGDIVRVTGGAPFKWGYSGIGAVSTDTGCRVVAINPNVSITIQPPLGATSPGASSACTLQPLGPGDLGTGTGQAADNWKKTPTMTVWADDWAANACVGAIRTMGIRKDNTSAEAVNWTLPTIQLPRYAGRTITFGALVYQKVQSGAGTYKLYIADGIAATVYSASGTGVAYSDPTYAGFQFLSVTATISPTASKLEIGLELNGTTNDVYYFALPTAIVSSVLSRDNCRQPEDEICRPVGHWNPPLLLATPPSFPSVQFPAASGLYTYNGIDLEAISLCVVHKSVVAVKCKIEWQTSTVGAYIFTGNSNDYALIFGPQTVTIVANQYNVDSGWLPLRDDGTFCLFTNIVSLAATNMTFDFDLVQLSARWSAN